MYASVLCNDKNAARHFYASYRSGDGSAPLLTALHGTSAFPIIRGLFKDAILTAKVT
jgi:hypothetical protein